MKRKGQVVNARELRLGRTVARWAASGMNIRDPREVIAAGKAMLVAAPAALAEFGRRVARERDKDGAGEFLTQATVMVALGFW